MEGVTHRPFYQEDASRRPMQIVGKEMFLGVPGILVLIEKEKKCYEHRFKYKLIQNMV